ncbi:MAG: serine hydrolase, partial [Actinomycetaceae bacterium]|nr:serine hydrolase [Actinomycetaceae bacterium]
MNETCKQKMATATVRTIIVASICAVAIVILVAVTLVPAARETIRGWIYHEPATIGIDGTPYTGKGYIVIDETSHRTLAAAGENAVSVPASLAKLFVIDYALTVAAPNEEVTVSSETLAKVKPGSSLAGIVSGTYQLKDLIAAMLVPSGNDAAYAVADYCGGKGHPDSTSAGERIQAFMVDLASYVAHQGWTHTQLADPSGYDFDAVSTPSEVANVSEKLLAHQWIRNVVKSEHYTIATLSGQRLT